VLFFLFPDPAQIASSILCGGVVPRLVRGVRDPGNKATCIRREGLVTGAVVTHGCGEVNMLNNLSG